MTAAGEVLPPTRASRPGQRWDRSRYAVGRKRVRLPQVVPGPDRQPGKRAASLAFWNIRAATEPGPWPRLAKENDVILDVEPVTKPRMTQRDKRPPPRPPVARYRAYADELRLKANLAGYVLGDVVDVIFHLPIPQSWSKKKRAAMTGRPHQQRPDADNLGKAFKDALSGEDCHVYDERWRKYWTDGPGYIEVVE